MAMETYMRALSLAVLVVLAGCKKDEAPTAPGPVKPAEPAKVAPTSAPEKPAPADGKARVISMEVTEDGYVPANVTVKLNEPVTLRVTRKTDETCARELLIDGTDINAELPLNTPVDIAWTPTKAGQVKFGCAMDKMISGVLLVE